MLTSPPPAAAATHAAAVACGGGGAACCCLLLLVLLLRLFPERPIIFRLLSPEATSDLSQLLVTSFAAGCCHCLWCGNQTKSRAEWRAWRVRAVVAAKPALCFMHFSRPWSMPSGAHSFLQFLVPSSLLWPAALSTQPLGLSVCKVDRMSEENGGVKSSVFERLTVNLRHAGAR